MEKKMWTTKMLLDLIFISEIEESWQIGSNKSLQSDYAQIVALLKAFDLYVEEKHTVYDKNGNKTNEESVFGIEYFLNGNFIRKRNTKEVSDLLKEILELYNEYQPEPKEPPRINASKCRILTQIFNEVIGYRRGLEQSMRYYDCFIANNSSTNISEGLIKNISFKELEKQVQKLDDILLKIIGEKEPVPETELIEKYGFPPPMRTLKEILDLL
jgi:hypothetical protein